MHKKSHIIHLLLIAAFVLSGISPACNFIGGKGYLEICAADGSLQKIEVSLDQFPFAEQKQEKPIQSNLKKDCAFCFAQDHQKSGHLSYVSVSVVYDVPVFGFASLQNRLIEHSFFQQVRAPPVTFS